MQLTTFTVGVLAALSTVWAMPLQTRDVFNPPITSPKANDVFTAGDNITVTWDTSVLPKGNTNKGMLVLGMFTPESENLDVDNPLATGFLLTDGSHQVTLPSDLDTASNYIIDLFGDSANISPQFTINAQY